MYKCVLKLIKKCSFFYFDSAFVVLFEMIISFYDYANIHKINKLNDILPSNNNTFL